MGSKGLNELVCEVRLLHPNASLACVCLCLRVQEFVAVEVTAGVAPSLMQTRADAFLSLSLPLSLCDCTYDARHANHFAINYMELVIM